MKKRTFILFSLSLALLSSSLFLGCSAIKNLIDNTPENFSEGIKYRKDYEDDILEIYDDAIVFDEFSAFTEVVLLCGSMDDFEDIADFYKEFFKDNEIDLLEEEESRDEYYARGIFEGYEFKMKIAEAEGEYIEDLFENVITLSTREIKEGERTDIAISGAPSSEPETTIAPTLAPKATDSLERPTNDQEETKLTVLDAGSWVYEAYWCSSNILLDWTIYINDASTGTMYYYDYIYGERWWDDFTYTIEDGLLTFYFSDGNVWKYFSYYDYGSLHLVNAYDFSKDFLLYNYGETYQSTSFSAYGDWLFYNSSDGFMGTISFWHDGTGYIYNLDGDFQDLFFTWENNNGIITTTDEWDYEIDSFTLTQKHNILEYTSQYDLDTFFYNRTDLNLILGSYELSYTNEPGLSSWILDLRQDYTAHLQMKGTNTDYEDDQAYWYIDYYDGMIYFYLADQYYGFDYHHFIDGIKLYDSETGYYYEFLLVE